MKTPSLVVCFFGAAVLAGAQEPIPRTWDTAAVRELEVPLADARYSPVHIPEETYYRIPVRTIYRSYPVYHPKREPAGYRDWLAAREPEVVFDAARLASKADWIAAGEIVFNSGTSFGPVLFGAGEVRNAEFYEQTGMPVAKDGTIPFARWVVRKRGVVELASMGCNTCHTRVMPDGTVVPGAQGNNPGDRQGAWMLERAAKFAGPEKILERMRAFARQFEMPWLAEDPNRVYRTMGLAEMIEAGRRVPAGVNVRSNTSLLYPPQIPDLIGVGERHYLDHTGLVHQKSIGDLMRYSSLVQDVLSTSAYGGPAPVVDPSKRVRFSDEQLFALATYLYSLRPPVNPNAFDARTEQGRKVFARLRCAACHPAPLYTSNKLMPVDGFTPPEEHRKRLAIHDRRVGTDPRYALHSRKGTGYYKVPSLKGLWYRGPLEHGGRVATLEEWFDAGRISRAPGHRFGLDLKNEDKTALIAFLKTL
ncbi:MAG: hypothetical protein JNK48_34995 [Bryobacterales bacterium]|nr:hypothetical protein [Bryobacterales bacterium]